MPVDKSVEQPVRCRIHGCDNLLTSHGLGERSGMCEHCYEELSTFEEMGERKQRRRKKKDGGPDRMDEIPVPA